MEVMKIARSMDQKARFEIYGDCSGGIKAALWASC